MNRILELPPDKPIQMTSEQLAALPVGSHPDDEAILKNIDVAYELFHGMTSEQKGLLPLLQEWADNVYRRRQKTPFYRAETSIAPGKEAMPRVGFGSNADDLDIQYHGEGGNSDSD